MRNRDAGDVLIDLIKIGAIAIIGFIIIRSLLQVA